MGSLTSHRIYIRKGCETGPTPGLSSLSEKTRKSNPLQMSVRRQHFFLSYLKALSVGPDRDLNRRPPARQTGAYPTELTGRPSIFPTHSASIEEEREFITFPLRSKGNLKSDNFTLLLGRTAIKCIEKRETKVELSFCSLSL